MLLSQLLTRSPHIPGINEGLMYFCILILIVKDGTLSSVTKLPPSKWGFDALRSVEWTLFGLTFTWRGRKENPNIIHISSSSTLVINILLQNYYFDGRSVKRCRFCAQMVHPPQNACCQALWCLQWLQLIMVLRKKKKKNLRRQRWNKWQRRCFYVLPCFWLFGITGWKFSSAVYWQKLPRYSWIRMFHVSRVAAVQPARIDGNFTCFSELPFAPADCTACCWLVRGRTGIYARCSELRRGQPGVTGFSSLAPAHFQNMLGLRLRRDICVLNKCIFWFTGDASHAHTF